MAMLRFVWAAPRESAWLGFGVHGTGDADAGNMRVPSGIDPVA
jgi:hypothetical protein